MLSKKDNPINKEKVGSIMNSNDICELFNIVCKLIQDDQKDHIDVNTIQKASKVELDIYRLVETKKDSLI